MNTHYIALSLILASLPLQAAPVYTKLAEIPIGGAGRFDYLNADGVGQRLYVSHGTEVVVIDTINNEIVGRIEKTVGVHGFAFAAELGLGFSTNGGENMLGIIDLKSLQTKSKVATGANPDALIYEPTQQQVWAFNHTGKSVTIVDALTGTAITTTALSGDAEAGQADAALGKVFINIEDTNSVDVVDMKTFAVIGNYPVAPASSPTGMAIDTVNHHLFVGGGEALVMMDTQTGTVLASAPICVGTDATTFDATNSAVFVSCSDGHITVIDVKGDTLSVVQTIDTAVGARTMTLDPVTHKLYTSAVDYLPADPAVANGRPQALQDTFRVLVFGPQ
jgi:DNA-binding beta-propeller fold protein YncE